MILDSVPKYRNVLLKLSGEFLAGDDNFGIDPNMIDYISKEIRSVNNLGVKISIVIGGGNIFRGINAGTYGMNRVRADQIGMIATIINALILKDALEKQNVETRVQSAVPIHGIAESYIVGKALNHIEKGRVIIFAAGTGNPYFTTDTAAVLRAIEMKAELVLKATKVDGLYDSDPAVYNNAKFIKKADYAFVIRNHLNVMDMTAISLAMENRVPLAIFSIKTEGNIEKIICGKDIGTLIKGD